MFPWNPVSLSIHSIMEYEFLQFYTIYPGNRPPRFHPMLFPMILQGIQALKNAFEHLFRCNISKKDLLTPQVYTHIPFQIINLKCSGSFVPAPSTIGYSKNPATKPSTVAKADTKTYDLSTGKSGKCCQFTPSHRHRVRSCFKKAKSFTIPSSGQITHRTMFVLLSNYPIIFNPNTNYPSLKYSSIVLYNMMSDGWGFFSALEYSYV